MNTIQSSHIIKIKLFMHRTSSCKIQWTSLRHERCSLHPSRSLVRVVILARGTGNMTQFPDLALCSEAHNLFLYWRSFIYRRLLGAGGRSHLQMRHRFPSLLNRILFLHRWFISILVCGDGLATYLAIKNPSHCNMWAGCASDYLL